MLHACFAPTILCFVYTLWYFYEFSRTNILTSATEPVSCFLLFLVSEKLVKKYSWNWTGQTPKSITFRGEQEVQRRAGGASQGGQTHPRRGWAQPRAWLRFGYPGRLLGLPLRL